MRFVIFMLSLFAAQTLAAQSLSAYRITHTYVVGGDGSWDYITPDAPNHRVFVGRQNRVMVVDTNDGHLLGEVTGIDGAHGVALVDHTGHGFPTSGNDGSVLMFDLKTLRVLGRIPAAEDADAILYDTVSDRVFTFNGDAHYATVVNPNEGTLVTNIPLGGTPESSASAGDGKLYVESGRGQPGGQDRRAERGRVATLVDRALPRAGGDGNRHRASSALQRLPQRSDGRLRL